MMRSLRGLIICEDPELRTRVQELLRESGEVEPTLVLQRYPERLEAARQIRLCRPEVVLLAIERLQPVVEFMKELDGVNEGVQAIGISRLQDPRALTELMRYGIRDCIQSPLNRAKFHEAIHRIVYYQKDKAGRPPRDPLVSFLPARGGSGTSTLACNVAHLLSRTKDRVLLTDFDLTSGVSRFLFKLSPQSYLGDFLDNSGSYGGADWRQFIVPADRLHVLQTGRLNPRVKLTPFQIRTMLEHIASEFTMICADLTGSMETYSLELLRHSRRIVVVATTEIPSIGLAKDKVDFLAGLDLAGRIGLALTVSPGATAPNTTQVQRYVGVPVECTLDFGEKKVRQKLAEGHLLDSRSSLGRQIEQYAKELDASIAGTAHQDRADKLLA